MSSIDPAAVEAVKARQRLTWGLDVEGYVKHTVSDHAPVAERILEIADPPWASSLLDVGCGPGTATLPAGHHHYAIAGPAGAEILVYGVGPFDITYVDPADDPRLVPSAAAR